MKKALAALVCIFVLMSYVTCFAHVIDDKEKGISFVFSDNWMQDSSGNGYVFVHRQNGNEWVAVNCVDADWAFSIEMANEDNLRALCEEVVSNSNLEKELSKENNANVSVKTDYTNESFEVYNGVKYYTYEKFYTASARGFYDTQFYTIAFLAAKNGKVYVFSYNRDESTNHFEDFLNLLNYISYESGEIKIKIYGERIYPDSAPVIIEGRTLVPIRAVAEKMGYNVSWDGEKQLVTMENPNSGTVLHFGIGYIDALKNYSEEITLDVPPLIIESRTYLPLRAAAEAMDASVNWNAAERTVEITE